MKNIIWSTGAGVVITRLAADALSADLAAAMQASGAAEVDWVPVAYDLAVTDEQLANVGDLRWVNGALALDPDGPLARAWAAHKVQAQTALDASDITMIRCVENGVTVPPAWATYRAALRAIVRAVSGDPTQPLPTRPAYPAGT